MGSEGRVDSGRQRALSESTVVGTVVLDADRRIVDCNAAYARIVGRDREELLGRPEAELDGTGSPSGASPMRLLVAGEIESFAVERLYLRPDGTTVRARVATTAASGAEGLYVGTVEDPSGQAPPRDGAEPLDRLDELREKAEALERAHELAKLGTITLDLTSRRLHCSREAARLLGVAEAFTCEIDAFRDRFVAESDRREWAEHMEAAYRRGGAFSVERRMRRASGEPIWARVHGSVEVDGSGTPRRAVSVVQDVTEQRALEEQFRQTQKMEAVGQLASGVAHDFNNLLLVIGGNAQLALASGATGADEELAEIVRATERAGELVRQLLAFSRADPPERRRVELNEIAQSVRRMLDRLLERTIEIRTELTERDTTVLADPARLEQALLNLAVNARDAMPGGGTLTISTAIEDGAVVLRVADTGQGMDAATRERIFEPFFTTKESGKGTGLGLPAVYRTIAESDGTIGVESESGRGTTFTIELPHVVDETAANGSRAADGLAGGSGERVLIVEDDPMVRAVSAELLTRAGYTTEAVCNGEDALRLFDGGADFDAIVSDLTMPRMTGPELRAALRERGLELPTVYVSGYPTEEALRTDDGPTRFVAKPFSGDGVAAAVSDLLQRH